MLLEMKQVTKKIFSSVLLDHVDFRMEKGEIHALIGPNGAGKTSLVNILGGVFMPDSGEILLNGRPYQPSSPMAAQKNGIFTVYQQPNLVDCLSIMENIFLGIRKGPFDFFMHWRYMKKKTTELLHYFDLQKSPSTLVSNLSGSEKNIITIAKACIANAEILIMDEPTAGLTAVEQIYVFNLLHKIKARGTSVIYITHRIDEVIDHCDSVTVLVDGTNKYSGTVNGITKDELHLIMSGRALNHDLHISGSDRGEPLLEVRNLEKSPIYRDISFKARKGQILGIAGAVGSGRSAILRTIIGEFSKDDGSIFLKGKKTHFTHPFDAIKNGVAYLTDDRIRQGIFPNLSVSENCMIAHNSVDHILIDPQKQVADTLESVIDLDIKLQNINEPILNLSGGNQQKVLLARCMTADCDILLLDEPTKGVDVSTRNDIYLWIQEKVRDGCTVVISSSEISELLMLSTYIIVLNRGRIADRMLHKDASEGRILAAMQS